MSGRAGLAAPGGVKTGRRTTLIVSGAIVVLIVAMALDTKVVEIGSKAAAVRGEFSPATYGAAEFPKVQTIIESRAGDASVLAAALAKDQAAAVKQYGVDIGGGGYEMAVKFTGVAGKEDFGVYNVAVPGVPPKLTIQVQTGPAIMGTDLRDGAGTITFGQFTNQIDYQNAGSAINTAMKRQVLSKIDSSKLAGKTISVVGAFRLSDPDTWLVTPVQLDVK